MGMYEGLKEDLKKHRLAGNAFEVKVLSFVVGQLGNKAKLVDGVKTLSDGEVLDYLKKHSKSLKETASFQASDELNDEIAFIEAFLPVMMTEDDLERELHDHEFEKIGEFMGYLKSNFDGLYDGKVASAIFKNKKF